MNVIA